MRFPVELLTRRVFRADRGQVRSDRSPLGQRGPERAVTLLELVIAATLVFASILATVGVIDSSSRAAVSASTRRTATDLATAQLAELEAMAYPELGIDPRLDGFESVIVGRHTVSVPGSGVAAHSTESDQGRSFEITRSVTWSKGSEQAPGVFKLIRIGVAWKTPVSGSIELTGASGPTDVPVDCEHTWVDASTAVLSGTINTYHPLNAPAPAGASEVSVAPAQGVPVRSGDALLVIQMTGMDAGVFEYAVAGSTAETGRLVLGGAGPGGGLVHAYGVGGAAQVVRVPTVGNAVLSADVVPPSWNGSSGAVVALDATGTISGPGAIRADGSGFAIPAVAGDSPQRLRPGGGSNGRGGGIVAVRGIGTGDLGARVSADGELRTGAAGGSVLLNLTRPTQDVFARGADALRGAGGAGGLVVTSAPVSSVSVAGGRGSKPGSDGTVVTGWASDDVAGLPAGAGCLPAIAVTKTAETPRVLTTTGATAVWTIRLRNAVGRGTATGVQVTDNIAAEATYQSTWSVSTSGGARRTEIHDPAPRSSAPRWGTFEIPPGGGVDIVVVGTVRPGALGAIGNGATVSLDTQFGSLLAGLPLDDLGADRVELSPFACDDPSTDAGFIANTYFPLLAMVRSGATQLEVAPGSGGPPLAPGDQALVVQMDGPNAGTMEYVRVAGIAGAILQLEALGPSGGLINGYGLDGAAQLVRVPTVDTVVVNRSLTVTPWDGRTGGVLAIDVVGELVFDGGMIDASNAGRNGTASGAGATASVTRLPTGSGRTPGGGVVALRSAGVDGHGTITAEGGVAGGGTVLLTSINGDLGAIDISASGRGGAGAALLSGVPMSVRTDGGGPAIVRTDVRIEEIPGTPLGSTCSPLGDAP